MLYSSSSFSWKYDREFERTKDSFGSFLSSRIVFLLPLITSRTSTEIQYRRTSTCSVPRYQTQNSTGILTCFPSTTPFGLALGPDSPSMDEPSGGILRFSGHWILTNVCVTQADILTSASSTLTYINASPYSRTLPYRYLIKISHSFGRSFSPGHFRRKNAPPVSYYALFKGWLLLSKPPGCLCILTSFAT